MAVVPSGYFGDYFNQYTNVKDARDWNTKNYDFAQIKNAGEISEDLTNENTNNVATRPIYGTGLFVKTNKYGTLDSLGRFTEDKINPFYVVRDAQDNTDYNYYVDQEKGNVYFRPTTSGTSVVAGSNVNNLRLPNFSDIQSHTPQYFGTSFTLDAVPNPESWGQGQINNFAYILSNFSTLAGGAIPPGSPTAFSDIELNGVKIWSNNLNTNTIQAIPTGANLTGTGAAAPLYQFSDSFLTGATDFSSVSPQNRWSLKGAINPWPGAGTTLNINNAGGVSVNTLDPSFAMWYPDTTDGDLLPFGASKVGVQDALFRTKFDLSNIPATNVNIDVAAADFYEIYVNGVQVPAAFNTLPNGQRLSIPPAMFKLGENIIGIHARDSDNDEGVYVSMPTTDIQVLGYDLSSKSGVWETALGYPLTGVNTNIGASTTEANRLFGDNWTYVPSTIPGNPGQYTTTSFAIAEDNASPKAILKQSYFNTRTADNFIMSVDMNTLANYAGPNAATLNPTFWSGVRIRANNATDLPEQSGYTVRWNAAGQVELYKAGANRTTPLPGALGNDNNVVAIATGAAVLDGTPKNLEVHANGYNIQVWVNGTQVINYNDDPNNYFKEGYSSLDSYGNYTSFQNFKLYSYAQPIQLLSRALKQGENNLVIKGYAQDNVGNVLLTSMASAGTIQGKVVNGTFSNIDLSSNNIPPNLSAVVTKDIMDEAYKASVRENITGTYVNSLDPRRAYWSVSSQSALGIAGKIQFKNREGGDVQKVRDQFVGDNNLMQNLNALLASETQLFDSHINVIK